VSRNRLQAQQTRDDLAYGKEQIEHEKQERMRKVAASRAKTLEAHGAASRAKEEMLLRRQIEAQKAERLSEIHSAQAKNALLRNNQMKRQQQFASRYVSTEAAATFEASSIKRYYAMDEVSLTAL
jgi:Rps23 Pro-64 3,4-dihydroxylase Tpa1-like proline 4-hydroxylase